MPVIPILIIADHSQDAYKFWKSTKMAQNKVYDSVEFYFLYADPDQDDNITADGNDLTVSVQEGVKEGCIMKTYRGLQWVLQNHPDAEYIIRANLSVIFNIDTLIHAVQTITKEKPTVAGLVSGQMAFGSFMLWNRPAAELLAGKKSLEMIKATGFQHNDDTTFSKLCQMHCVEFNASLSKFCIEHFFSYFYLPHINGTWISSKKVVDDISNRYVSDVWSVTHSDQIPQKVMKLVEIPNFRPEVVSNTMMNALHNLDCTGRHQYFMPNLQIMMQNISHLDGRFGELIYYIVKHVDNVHIASSFVQRVVTLPQYDKETVRQWIDLIFYYSLIKLKIKKNVYDMIGLTIGHNGEKNDDIGLRTV